MKLLQDTHVFLWLSASPKKLGKNVLTACGDPANELALSTVFIWEMQVKLQVGKLAPDLPLPELIAREQGWMGLL